MVKIIVVNGHPEAGKTTFEDFCIERLGKYWCDKASTIDFVKELATIAGWDGTKTEKNRAFLSDFKDLLTKWDNVPYKKIMDKVEKIENYLYNNDLEDLHTFFLMVDSREPEEIQRFKEAGAITVLVDRPSGDSMNYSNHADADVDKFEYDYYIHNNGTLEDLQEKANVFCYVLRKKFN